MYAFAPDIRALHAACRDFLNTCKCPLCSLPWRKASTFPCGHTFCYDCAIATLEGPGISQSECPTCKGKYWKRDLKPNPQMMAVVEHSQKILSLPALQAVNAPGIGVQGGCAAVRSDPDGVSLCTAVASVAGTFDGDDGLAVGLCSNGVGRLEQTRVLDDTAAQEAAAAPKQAEVAAGGNLEPHPRLPLWRLLDERRTESEAAPSPSGPVVPPLAALAVQRPQGGAEALLSEGLAVVPDASERLMGGLAASAAAYLADPDHGASCTTAADCAARTAAQPVTPTSLDAPGPARQEPVTARSGARRDGGNPPVGLAGPPAGTHGCLAEALPVAGTCSTPFTHDAGVAQECGSQPLRFGLAAAVATPYVHLAPQPRSQAAGGWVVNSLLYGKPAAGTSETCGRRQFISSVVSIRRGTPTVNNAYLDFHSLLELPVNWVGGLPGPRRPTGHHSVNADPGVPDEAIGGSWDEAADAAWLRRLAKLPAPTDTERDALENELSVVGMFLGELETLMNQWQPGAGCIDDEASAPGSIVRGEGRGEEAGKGFEACQGEAVGPNPRQHTVPCSIHGDGADQRGMGWRHEHGAAGELLPAGSREPGAGRLTAPPQPQQQMQSAQRQQCGADDAPSRPAECGAAGADVGTGGPARASCGATSCSRGAVTRAAAGSGPHGGEGGRDSHNVLGDPLTRGDDVLGAGRSDGASSGMHLRSCGGQGQASGQARSCTPTDACEGAGVAWTLEIERPLPEGAAASRGARGRLSLEDVEDSDDEKAERTAHCKRARTGPCGLVPAAAITSRGQSLPPLAAGAEPRIMDGRHAEYWSVTSVGTGREAAPRQPRMHGVRRPADCAMERVGVSTTCGTACDTARPDGPAGAHVRPLAAAAAVVDISGAPRPPSPTSDPAREPPYEVDEGAAAPAGPGATEATAKQFARRRRGDGAQSKGHRSEPPPAPLEPLSLNLPKLQQKREREAENALPSLQQPRQAKARERTAGPAAAVPVSMPVPVPSHIAAACVPETAGPGLGGRRAKPLYVLPSGLQSDERARVKELTRRVRGVEMLSEVQPHLTHLVVHLDSNRRAMGRTIKYLRAVMQGCWVVGLKWVDDSLAAGRLLPEGDFEATGDVVHLGTPALTRLRLERGDPPLFSSLKFCVLYLKGSFDRGITKPELESLLQTAGGTLVRRPTHRAAAATPAPTATAALALFGATAAAELYDPSLSPQQQTPPGTAGGPSTALGFPPVFVLVAPDTNVDVARVVREWGFPPVQTLWVYDCISNYGLLPVERYILRLQSLSRAGGAS